MRLLQTDDTGFPNKHLVRQIVTRDIEDQELKDFLQQSADDCFQILRGMENANKFLELENYDRIKAFVCHVYSFLGVYFNAMFICS